MEKNLQWLALIPASAGRHFLDVAVNTVAPAGSKLAESMTHPQSMASTPIPETQFSHL